MTKKNGAPLPFDRSDKTETKPYADDIARLVNGPGGAGRNAAKRFLSEKVIDPAKQLLSEASKYLTPGDAAPADALDPNELPPGTAALLKKHFPEKTAFREKDLDRVLNDYAAFSARGGAAATTLFGPPDAARLAEAALNAAKAGDETQFGFYRNALQMKFTAEKQNARSPEAALPEGEIKAKAARLERLSAACGGAAFRGRLRLYNRLKALSGEPDPQVWLAQAKTIGAETDGETLRLLRDRYPALYSCIKEETDHD